MATKMWSNLSSTKETGEMINLIEYYYVLDVFFREKDKVY